MRRLRLRLRGRRRRHHCSCHCPNAAAGGASSSITSIYLWIYYVVVITIIAITMSSSAGKWCTSAFGIVTTKTTAMKTRSTTLHMMRMYRRNSNNNKNNNKSMLSSTIATATTTYWSTMAVHNTQWTENIGRRRCYRRSVLLPRRRTAAAAAAAATTNTQTRLFLSSSLSSDASSSTNSNSTPSPQGNRRATLLSKVMRFRGLVDQGYGRGGKQLGVPTANLPSSLFQNALQDVDAGVYFGWAVLEFQLDNNNNNNTTTSNTSNNNQCYKAVVNVGYSPTFEGQENAEKIIEAHLIVETTTVCGNTTDQQTTKEEGSSSQEQPPPPPSSSSSSSPSPLPDFYGVPMRLQLVGFLRREQKFDSFPALVAQIHLDIHDAKTALDVMPFAECQKDPFLNVMKSPTWVGGASEGGGGGGGEGGGDANASWETVPMEPFLDTL